MVTLETDFNILKGLIGKDITIKQLEDTLFDIGMELDEVEENTLILIGQIWFHHMD